MGVMAEGRKPKRERGVVCSLGCGSRILWPQALGSGLDLQSGWKCQAAPKVRGELGQQWHVHCELLCAHERECVCIYLDLDIHPAPADLWKNPV